LAIKPVSVNFKVGGIADVLSALKSVRDAVDQSGRAQQRAQARAEADAKRSAAKQAREQATVETQKQRRVYTSLSWEQKTREQHEKMLTGIKNSSMLKQQREEEKSQRFLQSVRNRAMLTQQRDAEKSQKHVDNLRTKHFSTEQRKEEQWQKRRQGIINTSLAWEQRAREKASRDEERAKNRVNRPGAVERAATRALQKDYQERWENKRNFVSAIGGGFVNGVGKAVGMAGKVAGTLLALGGGFSAADAVKDSLAARGNAMDIQIQSNNEVDNKEVMEKAKAVSNSSGISVDKLVAAVQTYGAKSGDYTSALKNMEYMANTSQATGADLSAIATTMGNARYSFGNDELAKTFMGGLSGAGRKNAIDLADLGEYGVRLAGASTRYADKQGAVKDLVLGLQVAKKGGATTAAEASIAASQFATDIYKHEEDAFDLAGGRNNVMDENGKIRNQMDVVRAILAKNGQHSFENSVGIFNERARKVISGGESIYQEGRATAGKGATEAQKHAAGLANFDAWVKETRGDSLSENQLAKDSTTRRGADDMQLQMALTHLANAVTEKLVPALVTLIPKVEELIPAIVKLVDTMLDAVKFAVDHPYAATAAVGLAGGVMGAGQGALGAVGDVVGKKLLDKVVGAAAPSAMGAVGSMAGSALLGGGAAAAEGVGAAALGAEAAMVIPMLSPIIPILVAGLLGAGIIALIIAAIRGGGGDPDEGKPKNSGANEAYYAQQEKNMKNPAIAALEEDRIKTAMDSDPKMTPAQRKKNMEEIDEQIGQLKMQAWELTDNLKKVSGAAADAASDLKGLPHASR